MKGEVYEEERICYRAAGLGLLMKLDCWPRVDEEGCLRFLRLARVYEGSLGFLKLAWF